MDISREQFANSYVAFAFIRGLNFVIENDIRQVLKNNKLTFPSFRILWILYFDTNITMSDLTYLAQTNISNVFRQLIKLKEDGLVVIENGNDARTKKISLAKDGRKLVQDFIDENSRNSDLQIVQLIDRVSKEDFSKFIKVSSLLINELIGKPFSEFVTKSLTEIVSKPTSKP
ncbi:hypothetical protein PY093_06795 [Cytobacillus sp. S13-E01]|uniref:hypothetical protein n=1 Tax=Cytobacillus sp. S13-E01 TaxID=3031326 RepID=UPI0023D89D8A|nr:hypothetical protein [Cytobacillus sp. S13-E01]MDF0726420.1 hypothetical protein [Cytobacillus sp. S13-E01]